MSSGSDLKESHLGDAGCGVASGVGKLPLTDIRIMFLTIARRGTTDEGK